MGTATSRRAALAIAAAGLLLAGCGSGSHGPFAWLRTSTRPAGWPTVKISGGATIAYPPTWTRIRSDPGTASVALFGPSRRFLGYLNLTPRQGPETLANWRRFRVDHNGDEGDRHVRKMAVATRPNESCVQDSYTTATGVKYIEIACLVKGRVVVVGASPPEEWAKISPLLHKAIASVTV